MQSVTSDTKPSLSKTKVHEPQNNYGGVSQQYTYL
jgi:hypothetical protein